jgi:hypothetical protein
MAELAFCSRVRPDQTIVPKAAETEAAIGTRADGRRDEQQKHTGWIGRVRAADNETDTGNESFATSHPSLWLCCL